MCVKCDQLLPHLCDLGYLVFQKLVETGYIIFHVAPWFVDVVEQLHLLFHHIDYIIYVSAVTSDQLLFFLEDLFYEFFMFPAEFVGILGVFSLQVFKGRHCIVKLHLLIVVLRWL